jgi:predicted nucleic acid-binding protein
MTKVICNASPIIGLIGINQLNLLWELFDEVLIPKAVYNEIIAGNRKQELAQFTDAINNRQYLRRCVA